MILGIPCNCARNKYNARFPFYRFLEIVDENIVGLRIPESVKKQEKLYHMILQEFGDWFFHGCRHYGHFIQHTHAIPDFSAEKKLLQFIAPRYKIPLLYMIYIDSHRNDDCIYEPKVYLHYKQLPNLIAEIEYCRVQMEKIAFPCLYKMEPFSRIFPYENNCFFKHHKYFLIPQSMVFLTGHTVMFSLVDAQLLPPSLLNEYQQIFSQRLPFKYNGEKVLFSRHFFTMKIKDTPNWTRIIDIPTGRFIDMPTDYIILLLPDDNIPCEEYKILPLPFTRKSDFENQFNEIVSLAQTAMKLKKPIFAMDTETTILSSGRPADDEYY